MFNPYEHTPDPAHAAYLYGLINAGAVDDQAGHRHDHYVAVLVNVADETQATLASFVVHEDPAGYLHVTRYASPDAAWQGFHTACDTYHLS